MKNLAIMLVILFSIFLSSGCVRRIVTIDSQPPGAAVYFDRKLIGKTPCSKEFTYYGSHYLELVKEGRANFNAVLKLDGPFYEYFPFSFFSEVIIPWRITDEHNFNFKLEKGQTREPILSPITQPQAEISGPRLERIIDKKVQ